ncbi:MAG: serine hydrolase [Pseudomonadota bacterium]
MQISLFASLLTALLSLTLWPIAPLQAATPADRLERTAPEAVGFDPQALAELEAYLAEHGSSAMLLMRSGKVFFEFGDIHQPLLAHSMRKALLNSVVGIAVGEGALDLDATLGELDVESLGVTLIDTERTATFADVLKSRSGVYLPAAAETEGMAAGRPARGSHAPGTHYYYNNWDFNAAGAIYEVQSRQGLFEAFEAQIAEPLGMNWRASVRTLELPRDEAATLDDDTAFYQYERALSPFPAYHFRISAHDLALYGQLMLQRGAWEGQQLVPADWVELSTQPYSIRNAEWDLAYGMLWYVLIPDEGATAPPSFYHTGVGIHMLGIYPSLDLVMVHRVNTEADYTFHGGNLVSVIRLMHGARNTTAAE